MKIEEEVRVRGRLEDTMRLALKIEAGATSQGEKAL